MRASHLNLALAVYRNLYIESYMKNPKLYEALMATGHWGDVEVKLGIEFDFKCAYCNKDLLGSVDNYKEWQTEHIIPRSKGGADDESNFALTCRTCNFIKGVWNPKEHFMGLNPDKGELIEVSKKYIFQKRSETENDINRYSSLIKQHS